MKYALVATTSWLLLVDLHSRQVQPLEFNRLEYYGISWFPDQQELVLSHSGLNNSDLVDIAAYAQSERGCLSFGKTQSKAFLSATHQIICAPDRRVICANTGRNCISVFDFRKPNCFQEAGVNSSRWDRLALDQITGDHLNSVFLRDNHLYVIAHGHAHGSSLATFAYPELELLLVEPLGARTGLHNIWITSGGQRISCHSETGSLVDLDDVIPLWESGTATYTRGLAATVDYVLIGESQKTGRDLRHSSLSGLWILDRQNWQAMDHFCLGPYGAVNEIRILDEPDEAHHGHPFMGLPSLLMKDVRMELSGARISASASASQARRLWTDWEPVFGSPAVQSDGAKSTDADQLCLMIKNKQPDPMVAFAYRLEEAAGSHVSAVLGYRGNGGDCKMVALLVQSNGSSCNFSVWRHDGQEWACLPAIKAGDLPLSGTMVLTTTTNQASLKIDDKELITISADELGLARCDQGLGIRWIGGSVLPLEEKI